MPANWKSDKNRIIKPDLLLERLDKNLVFAEGDQDVGFAIDALVLLDLIPLVVSFDDSIPESATREIVLDGIKSQAKNGEITDQEQLISEIRKEAKRYLQRRPQKYVVETTISVRNSAAWFKRFFHRRNVNGTIITFSPSPNKRHSRVENVKLATKHRFPQHPSDYTYVNLFVEGRTADAAYKKAIRDFDLLRGIWNFALNFGKYKIGIGGRKNPYNSIVNGPYALRFTRDNRKPIDGIWVPDTTGCRPILATDLRRHWVKILSTEKWLRGRMKKSWTNGIISQLFIDYGRALDTEDFNRSYLLLWQLLEQMCGVSEQERHTTIVDRTSWLYENRDYHKLVLTMLMKERHAATHEGKGISGVDSLLSELRSYVEDFLRFLIVSHDRFKNHNELVELLKLNPDLLKLKGEIAIRKEAIRFHGSAA